MLFEKGEGIDIAFPFLLTDKFVDCIVYNVLDFVSQNGLEIELVRF